MLAPGSTLLAVALTAARLHYDPGMVAQAGPLDKDERLSRIEAVTGAALAHLDVEQLLAELLDRVVELLEVDTAAVLLVDTVSGSLVLSAARGIEVDVYRRVHIRLGAGFAGRVAALKRPVMVEQVDDSMFANPLVEEGIASLLGAPMLSGGDLVGVLQVGSLASRRFTEEEAGLLQLVADRVALSTQTRLVATERAAAAALQRSLLPTALPALAGLDLAARYIPGGTSGVGGDWYDVFSLPSGQLAMVIGDVVGHGLPAAVVMGRFRSALRAYALESSDPGEVLARLDRKAQHFEAGMMATVLYAVLDASLERVHISLAGHPAPVLAPAGGPVEFVDLPIDLLIGVESGWPRRTTAIELSAGDLLCFYTDGLVERRDRPLDEGLRRLRDSIMPGPAEAVCSAVLSQVLGGQPAADDVAILVARRTPGGGRPPAAACGKTRL